MTDEKIKEIDNKLDMTEDELTTTNLLYQTIDLLESIIESKDKRIYELVKAVEKKDKIIDRMAEEFTLKTLIHSNKTKKEVIEYFEKEEG